MSSGRNRGGWISCIRRLGKERTRPHFEQLDEMGARKACRRRPPMDVSLIVRREVQIAAPPATVFAFLTDPEKILRWMGTEATVEPHSGGLYLLKVSGRRMARGRFTEVIPVHRLAYSFGWEGSDIVPPESS